MRLPTIFTNGLVQLNVYFKIVNEIQGVVFSITGCSGIQLKKDYVNALVCVSVSLSLCVCKCVCIFVCVYVNVWLLRACERSEYTVVLSLTFIVLPKFSVKYVRPLLRRIMENYA